MLFSFLKYLQPTHYFGLKTKKGNLIFPKVDDGISSQFEKDNSYKSEEAKSYDQSWRALQNGYIYFSRTINETIELSVFDNYVFSRKYFSKAWVFYTFLIRILSLKNPFKEVLGFVKTRKIKRYKSGSEIVKYNDYHNFDSILLNQQPLVSL